MPNISTPNPPNGWTITCSDCNESYDTPIEPKPGGRWETCRPCQETARVKYKRGRMIMYDIAQDHRDELQAELGPDWHLRVMGTNDGYGINAIEKGVGRHTVELSNYTTSSTNPALIAAINKAKP